MALYKQNQSIWKWEFLSSLFRVLTASGSVKPVLWIYQKEKHITCLENIKGLIVAIISHYLEFNNSTNLFSNTSKSPTKSHILRPILCACKTNSKRMTQKMNRNLCSIAQGLVDFAARQSCPFTFNKIKWTLINHASWGIGLVRMTWRLQLARGASFKSTTEHFPE